MSPARLPERAEFGSNKGRDCHRSDPCAHDRAALPLCCRTRRERQDASQMAEPGSEFQTRGNKRITLSGVYRTWGTLLLWNVPSIKRRQLVQEAPLDPSSRRSSSGEVRAMRAVAPKMRYGSKAFAFTLKMLHCGNCGNGVTAEEKFKQLDRTIRECLPLLPLRSDMQAAVCSGRGITSAIACSHRRD